MHAGQAHAHETWLRIAIALAGLTLLASGCGSGAPLATDLSPTPAAPTSTPPTVTSAGEREEVAAEMQGAPASEPQIVSRGPEVGQPAPNFTLTDLDGRAVQLADFRGRPVLLNFFASWCGPCAKELPAMRAAQQWFKDQNLQLVLVNLQEDPATVRDFRERLGLVGVPILFDDRGVVTARTYRVTRIPSTYFINADGVIQATSAGELDGADLQRGLARIVPVEGIGPSEEPADQPRPGPGCALGGC
jgi:peroxiredoxin